MNLSRRNVEKEEQEGRTAQIVRTVLKPIIKNIRVAGRNGSQLIPQLLEKNGFYSLKRWARPNIVYVMG